MAYRKVAYSKNHSCVVFGAECNGGIPIEISAQKVPQNRQKLFRVNNKQVEWPSINNLSKKMCSSNFPAISGFVGI